MKKNILITFLLCLLTGCTTVAETSEPEEEIDYGDKTATTIGSIEDIQGNWDEGYHFFLTFDGNQLTIRDYTKAVVIETSVAYKENGSRIDIELEDNVLHRDYKGNPNMTIDELYTKDGYLHLIQNYTITGVDHYVLEKTDKGPFDDREILDDDYLDSLQGRWYLDGSDEEYLEFSGNHLYYSLDDILTLIDSEIHVIRYVGSDRIYIMPYDLTKDDFGAYTKLTLEEDGTLTGYQIVDDMDTSKDVFRKEDK